MYVLTENFIFGNDLGELFIDRLSYQMFQV